MLITEIKVYVIIKVPPTERSTMQDNNTIGYYNNHADEFYKSTVEIDFSAMQEKFLAELKSGSYILDFGCGSGVIPDSFWSMDIRWMQ